MEKLKEQGHTENFTNKKKRAHGLENVTQDPNNQKRAKPKKKSKI